MNILITVHVPTRNWKIHILFWFQSIISTQIIGMCLRGFLRGKKSSFQAKFTILLSSALDQHYRAAGLVNRRWVWVDPKNISQQGKGRPWDESGSTFVLGKKNDKVWNSLSLSLHSAEVTATQAEVASFGVSNLALVLSSDPVLNWDLPSPQQCVNIILKGEKLSSHPTPCI